LEDVDHILFNFPVAAYIWCLLRDYLDVGAIPKSLVQNLYLEAGIGLWPQTVLRSVSSHESLNHAHPQTVFQYGSKKTDLRRTKIRTASMIVTT
jgi:hypothetical protein